MLLLDCQADTRGQADEVDRIGHGVDLVKIIEPQIPALGIPPRAEIFDVQIAHRQHRGGSGQVRAGRRPTLDPAIERGPQKGKTPSAMCWCLSVRSSGIRVRRAASQAS